MSVAGKVATIAAGLQDTLAAGEAFTVVYPLPTAQPEAGSATILPAGGQAIGYRGAELKFEVVLVAATYDYDTAIRSLLDGIDAVDDALTTDPTAGGTCSGIRLESWGEFYTATIGGGADALAVRLTLSPTNPT